MDAEEVPDEMAEAEATSTEGELPGLVDLLSDLEKAAEETAATLSDDIGDAEDTVREGLDQAAHTIRQHPLLAVGAAAGLGFVLGLLMRGSGQRDDD